MCEFTDSCWFWSENIKAKVKFLHDRSEIIHRIICELKLKFKVIKTEIKPMVFELHKKWNGTVLNEMLLISNHHVHTSVVVCMTQQNRAAAADHD